MNRSHHGTENITRRGRLKTFSRGAGTDCFYPVALMLWILTCFPHTEPTNADEAAIPVQFHLDESGYITLVIDDGQTGTRVRNLVSETYFDAGEHTVYWDGYDEGRDLLHPPLEPDSRKKSPHYIVDRRPAAPGRYLVRGLVHRGIALEYERSAQSPGQPPWHTEDRQGAWLADHTPPIDCLFLPDGSPFGKTPQVVISAPIAEAGHNIMWIDTSGRKLYGTKLQGWEGPAVMARDGGPQPNRRYYAYGITIRKGKLSLWGFRDGDTDSIAGDPFELLWRDDAEDYDRPNLAKVGLAAWSGRLLFSRPLEEQLVFFDTRLDNTGQVTATLDHEDPRGLDNDAQGRIFTLREGKLLRYDHVDFAAGRLGEPLALVDNLVDPRRVLCEDDAVYVADWGDRQQVIVYSADGKYRRTIGRAGGETLGPYDPQRMHYPAGMAIDQRQQLWIAEVNYSPKRISLWDSRSGEFSRAYYGPPKYGGGGRLDPRDPTRYFYAGNLQGIEFSLGDKDASDESVPAAVYYLSDSNQAFAPQPPEQPIHLDGRTYLTNQYNGPHRFKAPRAEVFVYENGIARCVARIGGTDRKSLGPLLEHHADVDPALKDRLDRAFADVREKARFVVWSDLNLDGSPQAEEVSTAALDQSQGKREVGSVGFGPELSLVSTGGFFTPPPRFTARGVPLWNLDELEYFSAHTENLSDVVQTQDGFFVYAGSHYGGPLRGFRGGQQRWLYHNQKGPAVPRAQDAGQLIAATKMLGPSFGVPNADLELFAINGDKGSVYLLSSDGLYVTDLGGDVRTTPMLRLQEATSGMRIDGYSFNDEHFHPSITPLEDGRVYLAAGKEFTGLFRLVGLETIQRLPEKTIEVAPEAIAGLADVRAENPVDQQERSWTIPRSPKPPVVDGRLDDWSSIPWKVIDPRRNISAALQVHDETLYAAWRVGDPKRLRNRASDGWEYAFACGGGLDLMLRTDPSVQPTQRGKHGGGALDLAANGDVRLVVTRLNDPETGLVRAIRFQQIGGSSQGQSVTYASPIGEVVFDSVADVTSHVDLGQFGGDYELAVPLELLGLRVTDKTVTRGDIGVLIGDGSDTRDRVYWSNRSPGTLSDLPTEARLTPDAWGTWRFSTR